MKIILLIVSLLSCFSAVAGTGSGVIGLLLVVGNTVTFDLGSHSNAPSCSTQGTEWALDANTASGTYMYALLLSAKALNQTVYVQGSGSCLVYPYNRESIAWINVN